MEQNNKCGLGVASLIVGILSATIFCAGGSILGIVGLILGVVSLGQKEKNKGLAVGGIVTSCIGILMGIAVIIGCVFYMDEIKETLGWDEVVEEYEGDRDDKNDRDKRAKREEKKEEDDDEYINDEYIDDEYIDDEYIDDEYVDEESYESSWTTAEFAGYSYEASDGSVIYFEEDGTFIWYESDDIDEDNYYYGTYDVSFSEDALDYVINGLSELGVTEDEMNDYFERNIDDSFYQKSNFCCLVLHNEGLTMGGVTEETSKDTYYMGFYADGYYDAANMETGNSASFVLK